MDKLYKSMKRIGGIILFIIGVLTFYFQIIYENKTVLEVQTIDENLLTDVPNIKGLTVEYKFNDTIKVKNLWKIRYLLKNTGDVNIIGEGNNSMLLKSGIPLSFGQSCKILKFNIINQNNGSILKNDTLIFKQWRPNEFVELEVFIESKTNTPKLFISDREIIDSKIIHSVFNSQSNIEKKKLIERFPVSIKNTLKWTTVVALSLMIILGLTQIKTQFNNMPNKTAKVLFLILSLIFILSQTFPILWMF